MTSPFAPGPLASASTSSSSNSGEPVSSRSQPVIAPEEAMPPESA